MLDALKELIGTILDGIAKDEGCASQLADIAHECEQDGNPIMARGLRALSRNHQVKAMVGRGQLAAISAEYATVFDGTADPEPFEP